MAASGRKERRIRCLMVAVGIWRWWGMGLKLGVRRWELGRKSGMDGAFSA
jgi:hypothetical protein